MTKRSKLTEKATRMPETRLTKWEEIIARYLQEVEPLNSEPARSMRFGMVMQELLGFEPGFIESYISGIERYLKTKQKDRIVKGRVDDLFGNVVIEFEKNIPKHRAEAEDQLRRYVSMLWSEESPDNRVPYLCVATDGVRFVTYSPILTEPTAEEVIPDHVYLQILEEADWTTLKPDEVSLWLDRYFLRKEILHPTSEMMVRDFGVSSHAFQTATNALLTLWKDVSAQSAFAVVYESWEKYLRIVYGSEVAGEALFIRHTYLATLAKLMAWMRINENMSRPDNEQIIEMLEGLLFKRQGIENFIEEDFFSWLARSDAVNVAVSMVRWLFSLLHNYNLRELSEDVLKSLYQELVDPETRHDLGEFYTPDWLAHRMIRTLLDDANLHGALLDPACGSGTFLYLAIREKRERLGDSSETLRHILNSVYGADIHPLAVIVAKTNYILALGDLLKRRKSAITMPIYLTDTIMLPERWAKTETADYEVTINGRPIYLPEPLLHDLRVYDQAIELAKEFAQQSRGQPIAQEAFRNFLVAQHFPVGEDEGLVQKIFAIADALKRFMDTDRDTIWAFVLKNIYKPLFFKDKFDFIVGNPPWIAFRYMEPTYQAFLKRQITSEYRLLTGRGHLITHLEVATLFLVRAADLYLKSGGTISFVLPKSLFSADQHDGLRRRTFKFSENTLQTLFWRQLWDCENVAPLFNVPSCVLIGEKDCKSGGAADPVSTIPGEILSGKLERKNASLAEAERALTVEKVEFSLHTRGRRSFWATDKDIGMTAESFYKPKFSEGATIVPRSFWFVQVKSSPLGFNPDVPPVQTDPRAIQAAKPPYQDVRFEGNVENRFLYATLLSTDLLPFGHLDYRLVVLPIDPQGDHYKLVNREEARERGCLNLARWLDKAEGEWAKRRGAKAGRMSIYERLDRVHGLTHQNPQVEYRVLYPMSATYLCAAVEERDTIAFEIEGQSIRVTGLLADYKLFEFETNNGGEAFYLASLLNAPIIDKLIKPMQSRGLWGPRDICKKVLELSIPQFDAENPSHLQLAELGEECSAKVEQWLADGGAGNIKSIGKLRGMVREMLKDELKEIDALVEEVLR